MELYDVVTKLIGPIQPVGETNEDEKRFKNLTVMTHLIDELLFDISRVSSQKSRQEFSLKKAGEFASRFLSDISEQ
jgi:hypothetical protein